MGLASSRGVYLHSNPRCTAPQDSRRPRQYGIPVLPTGAPCHGTRCPTLGCSVAGRLWRSAFGFLCLVHTQASMRHLFLCGPAHSPEAGRLPPRRGCEVCTQSLRIHSVPIWKCPQGTQKAPEILRGFHHCGEGSRGPLVGRVLSEFARIGTPWVPASGR